jgi:phosphoribosylaminoimidazole-succinocarboxamide synthase
MTASTILHTDLKLEGLQSKYTGKVREVYRLDNDLLILVATDRLSAFDVVLPKGIPFKGQILNQIATKMLEATEDIVPNWLIASPDPNVSIGKSCTPFKIEMVIRGYLAGHAARTYKKGLRTLCGVSLPEGMKENDKFETPIITPATKAEEGHDEDISRHSK